MVGAFPPPTHGMAAVNAAVHCRLLASGNEIEVIDVAALTLDRGKLKRLGRLPRVLRGWWRLATLRAERDSTLYMSVSGGFGQAYEIGFLALARVRRMRCVLHHHSFAYLDRANRLTALMLRLAGRSSVQVVLSAGMGDRLVAHYGVHGEVLAMSNAALLLGASESAPPSVRRDIRVLGFLSNLSAEKGVFDFLDTFEAALANGLKVVARLAGPFQDEETERRVRLRLQSLPLVEYLGPVYGEKKAAFYSSIDVLLFPTHYKNEAEPLVILEAMRSGVPVIAYGRGAIPEHLDRTCGHVVSPDDDYKGVAVKVLRRWASDAESFRRASEMASTRFKEIRDHGVEVWAAFERILTPVNRTECG